MKGKLPSGSSATLPDPSGNLSGSSATCFEGKKLSGKFKTVSKQVTQLTVLC
ncbi:MAG: hypothetical protein LBV47_00730 [Bacteroidales bacterium]|nr:hypothetical protein [Bacteroidales bacterium]